MYRTFFICTPQVARSLNMAVGVSPSDFTIRQRHCPYLTLKEGQAAAEKVRSWARRWGRNRRRRRSPGMRRLRSARACTLGAARRQQGRPRTLRRKTSVRHKAPTRLSRTLSVISRNEALQTTTAKHRAPTRHRRTFVGHRQL